MALLLCGAAAGLGPVPTAAAAPKTDAGIGTVVADLGPDSQDGGPGFSHDGAYFSHLVPSGDRCDLHLYDVAARQDVGLVHAHVVCDRYVIRWAAQSDTLQWQVDAGVGEVTAYAWDAADRQVSVLAPDAHVERVTGLSADGAYLSFVGRSDLHPAPPGSSTQSAAFTYDRGARRSLPLSTTGEDVRFLSWSPAGHHFVGEVRHGAPEYDAEDCFGTGTSCQVVPDPHVDGLSAWSDDGTAAVVSASSDSTPAVYDFGDDSVVPIPTTYGFPFFTFFVGRDARRVVGYLNLNPLASVLWDRRTGKAVRIPALDAVWASPDGKYLLYRSAPYDYHYRDVATGADALATYRGTRDPGAIDGYWTKDGSSHLGIGPGGCSSLRQWSPATNTVSLFGPPSPEACYYVPQRFEHDPLPSSASGRFGVVYKGPRNSASTEYVADLRRHVLLGPVKGHGEDFAPAGSELLAIRQPTSAGVDELLLVDPTPVPDVDDKPRWSSAAPSTGTAFTVEVGQQVHVVLQAFDLQGTPVNPYFRWRTADGTPVKSPPRGWSCERRRLAAGATVSDCTFAPPKDHTAVRFLDLSATNSATGAQTDTRSYRLETKPAPRAARR
ncbi:hypothetical protein [Microlunatus flavus]|uniref:YD repeat-containing protein n=1 Tax=Microlunatus flavus TaxID=1036181 RepID=A0A1H9AAG5_9ACTN|nr:hypothetical protein [Microlunatus flavus]SEP73487.1 YD repeat-containing protein [Microlunatus flavus]